MGTKVTAELNATWLHYDPIVAWKAGRQATLSIYDGKKTDLYLVRPHFHNGVISYWAMEKCREVGVSLAKGEHEEYHVMADFSACDCPWGTYKAWVKPCRHRTCLAKALASLEECRQAEPPTGNLDTNRRVS